MEESRPSDNHGAYEAVADDLYAVPNKSFRPFSPRRMDSRKSGVSRESEKTDLVLQDSSALQNYQYMIGVHSSVKLPGAVKERLNVENPLERSTLSNSESLLRNMSSMSSGFINNMKKSFAFGKRTVKSTNSKDGSDNDAVIWEAPYADLPLPFTQRCSSKLDFTDDSLVFKDYMDFLRSPVLHECLLTGIRIMVFSVFPAYVLVEHPNTKNWFVSGQLIPTLAASLHAPNLGAQMKLTVMIFQSAVFLFFFALFVKAINLSSNSTGWWFSIIVLGFLMSLPEQLASKRLIIVFSIMVLEFEKLKFAGTEGADFAFQFAKNFVFAGLFGLLGALLPFPNFTYRLADEKLNNLHRIYAAAVGSVVKGFWAPVLLDAEIAVKQIPWVKIRKGQRGVQELIGLVPYEPIEFGLKNSCRAKRLQQLNKIRRLIYMLSAGASLHTDTRKTFMNSHMNLELEETFDRFEGKVFQLSSEMIEVLNALGSRMTPEEVLKNDFSPLAELSSDLEELIIAERDRTLFLKKFPRVKTNYLLRFFAFHSTLCNLANEIIQIESWAVSEEFSSSFFQRAVEFLWSDYWRNLWIELPRRILLSTPRDVRLVKDSIRYTLAVFAVVGFTSLISSMQDPSETYVFGMAILVKIAQQTASETIRIGIMRISGLAFGASFGYTISTITTSLWYTSLLLVAFGFLGAATSNHPALVDVGQYAVITTVAGIFQARSSPQYLLSRVAANIVAFLFYLIISLVIFPVDPIRVVFNYKAKILVFVNDLNQLLVAIGCCPITKSGVEAQHLIRQAEAILGELHVDFLMALDWNEKAPLEPTLRGDVFPFAAFNNLFICLAEMASVQESLLYSLKSLHRNRENPPTVVTFSLFELIRPFLIDSAKLSHRYFQLMIDSTDSPFDWSLESTASQLWRTQLAMIGFRRVTGNLQWRIISTLLPGNSYSQKHDASYDEPVDSSSTFDEKSLDGSFADLMVDMHNAIGASGVEREDLAIFENLSARFVLLLSTINYTLDSIIIIHGYELSRRS